jgi:hypothetical protein
MLLEILQDASESVSDLCGRLFLPVFNAWCERSNKLILFANDLFLRMEKIAIKVCLN